MLVGNTPAMHQIQQMQLMGRKLTIITFTTRQRLFQLIHYQID